MKSSRLIMLFIVTSSLLIVFVLWRHAKPLYFKRLEAIRISKIQKVCMKDYPRKRDYHISKRDVESAQIKINKLLKVNPIIFEKNDGFKENNHSTEITLHSNKVVLARVVDVINNVNEDVVLNIEVHTDDRGSNRENLKFSQNYADKLKSYIEKRSHIVLVTSIGYGEEFPPAQLDENLSNKRIEMSLKRVEI